MAIPSKPKASSKNPSDQSNTDCNEMKEIDELYVESKNTEYSKIDEMFPPCSISCNVEALIHIFVEENTTIKTDRRIKFELKQTRDQRICAVRDSNIVLKDESEKTVLFPLTTLFLVFYITILYLSSYMMRLYSRGCYTLNNSKKATTSIRRHNFLETIYGYEHSFLKERISLKRQRRIFYLPDLNFHSIYAVFPANTLTECYKEIETNPDMSFREMMQYDMFRTSTFSEFPRNSPVSTLKLAKAGFYYEGNADEAVCFKCGKRYRDWQELDDPLQIHRAVSPSCQFLSELGSNSSENTLPNQLNDGNQGTVLYRREHENRNVVSSQNTISDEEESNSQVLRLSNEGIHSNFAERLSQPQFQTVCQISEATNSSTDALTESYSLNPTASTETTLNRSHEGRSSRSPVLHSSNIINENLPLNHNGNHPGNLTFEPSNHFNSSASSYPVNNDQPRSAASTLEPLGISIEKPKYPQYAVLANRIASFKNWPEHLHQKPEDLAKSGFLYEGTNDFTRCFFCGGGLRDWEYQDDPWIEHARWYQKCVFVRQCRGEDFVNLVQQGKIQEAMDKVIFENYVTFKSDLNGRERKSEEEQRQINEIWTSPAVQSVREMGYSQENVRLAVHILKRNDAQITADSLLQCVLEIEEGDSNSREPSEEGTKHKDNESKSNTISLETTCERKLEDETETLLAENRQLKEQQICKICMDEDISIVFLPCGHMATCVNCAPAVRKCPLCRRFIKGTVKAIMS